MAETSVAFSRLEWGAVLVVPALALVVGAVAMPHPQPSADARASVDRAKLGRDVAKTAPPLDEQIAVELAGGRLVVTGANLPKGPVDRGSQATIETVFEVKKEIDRDWKIFLHVDLRGGRHRLHGDHPPVDGRYPTSSWMPGEFVTDRFELAVPLDAPPGEYEAYLGFYIGDERMPVTAGARHDGENRVRLGRIRVP